MTYFFGPIFRVPGEVKVEKVFIKRLAFLNAYLSDRAKISVGGYRPGRSTRLPVATQVGSRPGFFWGRDRTSGRDPNFFLGRDPIGS